MNLGSSACSDTSMKSSALHHIESVPLLIVREPLPRRASDSQARTRTRRSEHARGRCLASASGTANAHQWLPRPLYGPPREAIAVQHERGSVMGQWTDVPRARKSFLGRPSLGRLGRARSCLANLPSCCCAGGGATGSHQQGTRKRGKKYDSAYMTHADGTHAHIAKQQGRTQGATSVSSRLLLIDNAPPRGLAYGNLHAQGGDPLPSGGSASARSPPPEPLVCLISVTRLQDEVTPRLALVVLEQTP
ncbi:hypothetical protein BD309DRAFT_381444 [Dichomitus squalens]|nr:hypothetical protein BD309DRAFT_381444 [Dichomitus squalens]